MPGNEYQGLGPVMTFAAILLTAALSWFAQAWRYRHVRINEKMAAGDRLIIHRDELTFELLQNARSEMLATRTEMDGLRTEIQKLRSMEDHFFHFQQALDHIEALLMAKTDGERTAAERNARAFLNRMRRLENAKGTIANETQRASSKITLFDRDGKLGENS